MIGEDAAVSSIMDGDDADGEPAGKGERNRNGEKKKRGRETQSAALTHGNARGRGRHTVIRVLAAAQLTPRHTPTHCHRDTHTYTFLEKMLHIADTAISSSLQLISKLLSVK